VETVPILIGPQKIKTNILIFLPERQQSSNSTFCDSTLCFSLLFVHPWKVVALRYSLCLAAISNKRKEKREKRKEKNIL
jgi:hypothetical protein